MSEPVYHKPVLLEESIKALDIKPNGVYVDVTFGGGGHSREILKYLDKGHLIAFDQDPEAKRNAIKDPRFHLVDQNFLFIYNWVKTLGFENVDGVMADLGVSSHQFDSDKRGFSIRFDAPLDMRMDMKRSKTAEKVINTYEERELAMVLRNYGEVDQAMSIARTIIRNRPLRTSGELIASLERYAPRAKEHKFYAQIFQALRIEVNDELDALMKMLEGANKLLKPNGRLVVISYHSLEDRLVKDFMKTGNFDGEPIKDFFGNLLRPLKPLGSKPILPAEAELEINTRARSAKLRVAERINENQ